MATRHKTGKRAESRSIKGLKNGGLKSAKWAIVDLGMVKENIEVYNTGQLNEQEELSEDTIRQSVQNARVSFEDFSNALIEKEGMHISQIRNQIFNDVFLHVFAISGIERRLMDKLISDYFDTNIRRITPFLSISDKTYYNQDPDKKFSTEVSEKFLYLLRLYIKGEDVFGEVGDFNHWLDLPNPQFKNIPPSKLLRTGFGISAVMNELGRIEYGILA